MLAELNSAVLNNRMLKHRQPKAPDPDFLLLILQMLSKEMKLLSSLSIIRLSVIILLFFIKAEGIAQKSTENTLVTLGNNSLISESKFVIDTFPGLVSRENEIRAGLLYDAEQNKIVWEKDMYYAYPIASLTKMMVALLAVEDIRAGKVDWSDEVTVERVYRKSRRSRHVYKTTETYTLESLVQLAMIPSNNQACVDIAKYLNNNLESFVQRMNEKAASLQMKNTFYSNPSGLPGAVKEIDNSSSPHDLLLLSLEMIKYEEILKITSIGYAEVSNNKRSGIFRNHNHLVINYENDVDGLKTGYTKRAKFCLVATSKKEGHRLISIVLGVDGPYLRNEIVSTMLNNYYEKIGCGVMLSTVGGPVARKSIVSDPAIADLNTDNSNVTYKTVWTKQRKTHIVRNGETLSSIAQKYNSTYKQVKNWNRLSSNKILRGQKILVYVNVPKKVAVKNVDILDNEDETVSETDNDSIQTVLTEEQILTELNLLTDTLTAKPAGKPLAKNTKSTVTEKAKKPLNAGVLKQPELKKYVYHTVQPGDTLWSIAQRYEGISVNDIKRVNNIHNSKTLRPGTKLKIKLKVNA
jgi:D-alanyl-D-alanine carboxypeptidase